MSKMPVCVGALSLPSALETSPVVLERAPVDIRGLHLGRKRHASELIRLS
jgi:hypothetical protein